MSEYRNRNNNERPDSRRQQRARPLAAASWRFNVMLVVILIALAALVWRIVDLQVVTQDFLAGQGDARTVRVETIDAHRGMITDRDGEPLAVSTPVITIWANPKQMPTDRAELARLAQALGQNPSKFIDHVNSLRSRGFIYLHRRMTPDLAQRVLDLDIPGVYGQHEYKRYYPAGEVTAQLLGVTNVDDKGQEGLELAYDRWLTGTKGQRRVLVDRKGRLVRDLHLMRDAHPGGQLHLSINQRLQFLAYRELTRAVEEHNADAGSLVMMNARTGEVLASADVPSFNPNNRAGMDPEGLRERVLTDAFEPGSVMKPLAMSAIIDSGKVSPNQIIDTSPGYVRVDGYTIHDVRNFGRLTLTGVITKSSNVGMTKLALSVPNDTIWNRYNQMGIGRSLGTGFPGEATGSLPPPSGWSAAKRATLAYGYGMSVSPLQLATAYTTLANDGCRLQPSLLRLDKKPQCDQLISSDTAHKVVNMMETVVGPYGGGGRANIDGYRIAGKTGTVHKVGASGYERNSYRSNFVGIAPASDPRLIVVISIDNSRKGGYYGGVVSAPVFSRVAGPALRMLDVPPDSDAPAYNPESPAQQVKDAEQAKQITGLQSRQAAKAAARGGTND
ncbi:peptidoglycan D,D-transpeptidase FtsI family protein [Carnimonas bestiolae]|uniref:peptidoglycan D,D-transpeptidase FtsI family protein n=1 Tax=Carnimonas bestiolae TaxID=3402172 RepID=UPI003EDC26D0